MNTNTCPNCGKPLDPGALGGLCPACMAGVGLGTQTLEPAGDDPAGGGPRFTPPTPEQLSPHFPQLEILSLLGQGGMGAVYKARQRHLDRMVALKILPPARQDPAFSERFEREAKALAKLNHPNIVTLYEFGQADGFFYLLMEFVDGMNLGQVLRAGKLSPEEALAIVPHICDALQYAHDRGIVHRDIKPENILLGKEGAVKIADFGVAKIVAGSLGEPTPGTSAQVQPELTEAGRVLGTPRYMAPEQASSPLQVDHRADIYSLGVVFYQMLTGELPAGKLEPPSRKVQIDVRLDEVVLRAMEKEPSLRYQQASEVKTEVESIAGSPPAKNVAEPTMSPNAEPNPWQPVIAIVVVILCTAGSIAAFAVPFPASAIVFVLASTGVAVSLLRLAGFWPWRSPMFPHSNWASRNLRPGPHWRLRKVLLLVALVVLIPLWIHVLFVLLIYSSNQVAPGKHPSVNAPSPSGLMSSSVGSNQPLVTQKGVTELQPDGIVRIKVTVDFVNQTGQPVETNHFLNGDSVHVEKIYDAKGRPLIFQAKPRKGDHIDYNLVFNEPVPPGGMISYTTEGTITGLIKATDEPNVFKFHYMNRWPANSRVSFSERYRLPPGAKLIDKSPEDLKQETVGDHIELTIDQLIPRGGYIEVNFRYRLANTQNTSQLKTFGPVIERELTEENGIIAFDTGEVVKLPESVQKMNGFGESIAAAATWLERHKMDAVYSAAELDGFNMKVRPLKGEEWDTLTPGELKQMVDAIDLDRQPTFRMTTEENGPSTYAFQTREGGMGIAQILGYMTDKEGSKVGMKIRYKLLQNAALSADAASQPDSSASAHPSAAPTQTPSSQPNQDGALKNRAADFVDLLAAGKFADATDQFAGVMRKALPETKLAGLWHDLGGSGGKYLGHDPVTRVEKSGEYFCVYVPCRWERARVDLKVVFDSAGKISGLWEAAPENAGAPGEPVQPRTEAEKNALAAALPWLAANDAGDYSKSWKESAAIVRSSVTESGWNLTMGMSRKPLGNLVSRRLKFVQSMKSPPNAPEGDYVVMQFDTAFTAGNVVETVTFVLEADGQWRAAGYFLK